MVDGPLHEVTFCSKCGAESHIRATSCSSCGKRFQVQPRMDAKTLKQIKKEQRQSAARAALQAYRDASASPRATSFVVSEGPQSSQGTIIATVILFLGIVLSIAALSSRGGQERFAVAWVCLGATSLAASWLLIRGAILSALRQWDRERR